jgi:integrase
MAGSALTKDEAANLIAKAEHVGRTKTALRDAAMLAVMYRCGLRSAEVSSLDLDDLELRDGLWSLVVRYPKGWRRGTPPRTVGVDPGLLEIFERWLLHRGREAGPLFCTNQGERVHPTQLRRKIKQAAKAAGVKRRVHCHGLRHTFAIQMDEEGQSMKTIQDSLGHRSLATTGIYLARHSSRKVVEATAKRGW